LKRATTAKGRASRLDADELKENCGHSGGGIAGVRDVSMNEVTAAAAAVPFLFFFFNSFIRSLLFIFLLYILFFSLSFSLSLCSFPSSSSSCSSCSSLIFKPSNPFVGGVEGGSNTNNERHRQAGGRTDGRTGDVVSSSAAAATAELIYDRVMDCLFCGCCVL
jgi:hypothetical protein